MKRPTSHRSIYKFAKQWKREQQKCLTITENSNSSQVHVISYEDLIEKDDSLDAILSFLNVKLEQNNINNVDVGSSHEWKNINSDVMKTNKQKFLKELSKREIQLIESVCKEEMKVLNYTLVSKDLNVSKIYVYYDILIGKYIGKWNKLKKSKSL